MPRRLALAAVVAVFVGVAGYLAIVRAPAGGPARTLTVATTVTLAPLSEELAANFRRNHPEVVILVDRFVTADEARREAASGRADVLVLPGTTGERIGRHALALAADPALGLHAITSTALGRIYSQTATLWSDIGDFASAPITPVDRTVIDADHQLFVNVVLGHPQDPVNNALIVPDDAGAAAALSRPGTIAYLGLRSAAGAALVDLDGVACSPETVRSGAWRLAVDVRAEAVSASGSRYPSDFVRYARSPAGQAVVDRHEVAL